MLLWLPIKSQTIIWYLASCTCNAGTGTSCSSDADTDECEVLVKFLCYDDGDNDSDATSNGCENCTALRNICATTCNYCDTA